MSVLEKFTICEIIPKIQKAEIKRLFVFDDRLGYNILFVTNDDNVYGFGSNCYGSIGLGFSGNVVEPQVIPELCGNNIVEFYNGLNYAIARAQNNDLFSWGVNDWGQLGHGQITTEKIFLKPSKINFFDQYDLDQISCGKFHCLLLTKIGKLFGWGDNRVGQIGCGQFSNSAGIQGSASPIELKRFSDKPITKVVCSYNRSFALISDGLIYSWGENMWKELGHELEQNETLFQPKLINLHNVAQVCPSHRNTYFLTKDGFIYFCGRDESETILQSENEHYQYVPRLLTKKMKFNYLHQIPSYQKYSAISTAMSDGKIYEMAGNRITKTNYSNFVNFYLKEYQMSYMTIDLDKNSIISEMMSLSFDEKVEGSKSFEISDSGMSESFSDYPGQIEFAKNFAPINKKPFASDGLFEERHENFSNIGRGGYGFVVKATDKLDKQEYAMKIVQSKDNHEELQKRIQKELEIMAKLNSDYVVNYKTSWFDSTGKVYIKMECCADNLKNIIDKKAFAFKRIAKSNSKSVPMIAIEYFFSCELFKELLECVRYLHESEPPIIHRDLKPSNILISYNNRNGRFLKVCDFGLATFHESEYMTHTQELGTRKYIAFEVSQSTNYDTRADVYSVGIIAQEIFDFDINNSDTISRFENLIREKFKYLEGTIISMLHNLFRQRPSCKCVLQHYDLFALDSNKVKGSQNFDSIMKRLKDFENPFFWTFMNQKLNL